MRSGSASKRASTLSAPARKLARPGDPYVTSDGRVIAQEGAITPVRKRDADGKVDASGMDFKPTRKRGLKELPAPPRIFNGVACVFVYAMMGVGDYDIAQALNLSVEQVRDVKKHAAYRETFDSVVGEFINVNSQLLQARIAAYGQQALTGLAEIAINGKSETNVLRASMDLLDLGGHRKKDAQKAAMGIGELRIVVVDGQSKVAVDIGDVGYGSEEE